jgi:polysaccharide export outer membrane protein
VTAADRSTSRLAAVALCLAAVCAGCSSAARRVNEAAVRTSMSSQKDRQLALATLAQLPDEFVDYRIGPSDVLEIGVFQWELAEETKTLAVRVSQEGTISLPLIGDLEVKDKTVREVRRIIEAKLQAGDFIKNPRVSVVIREFRSKRIAVVGAVRDPGTYTLRTNVARLVDLLSLAGGLTESAGPFLNVIRTRNEEQDKQVITIDLIDLLEDGDLTLNVVLSDGDLVHVPVAPQFYVYGFVRTPGAYDLKRPTTVLEAIALAGGLVRPSASPGHTVLHRGDVDIPIDLTRIADGKAPNLFLHADDVIEVRQTALRRTGLLVWQTFTGLFHVGYTINN